MVKNHLKSIAAPKMWKIERKEKVFVLRSSPGKNMKLSVPLCLAMRDFLKLVKTQKEAKKVLENKEISVNGKRRKVIDYPVGFLDVLKIKETKEFFRLSISELGYLKFVPIKEAEENVVAAKIIGKTMKSGKIQLNLFNGFNITVDKNDYKINESVLFDFNENKIKGHLTFKEGASVIIVYGKNVGKQGKIKSVGDNKKLKIETSSGDMIESTQEYVFVVGNEKPSITV